MWFRGYYYAIIPKCIIERTILIISYHCNMFIRSSCYYYFTIQLNQNTLTKVIFTNISNNYSVCIEIKVQTACLAKTGKCCHETGKDDQ